jgi:ribosomal protein L11 methyltransferase
MASWLQVELTVAAEEVAAVEAVLQALGALSVSLTDPGGEPILEPDLGTTPLWSRVIVSALLPEHCVATTVRERLAAALGTGVPALDLRRIADRDWVREFRENLRPLRFGAGLWVCPPGSPCPDPAAARVELEPGLAFGSGSHPTTALCLEWLAGLDLAGRAILDWGCGSGVLAVAALKLGAATATALDIDPQALEATRANALRNGCAGALTVELPAALPAQARFDVVVANILADSLVALAPVLQRHCAAGARVALSGILAAQAIRVRDACAPWLALGQTAESNGWVLLTGTAAGSGPRHLPDTRDVHPLPEL